MSTETQVKLKFISVDFPVVNFNSEKQFLGDGEIHIDIEPKVYLPKDDSKHFKIIQEVNVLVEDTFRIFIIAIGNFELNDVQDDQLRKSFINLNAPAIMFPYIRSFISTLTSNLGDVTGTLNIPPQFFKGELPVVTEEDFVNEK
ncbi:MAG TPA: protein-export chaperone SecB [Sphingobacterium sp.]|nr:protein-export chaperone SecB [Sphingobacterium sp.]